MRQGAGTSPITVRELPPAEWDKLQAAPLGQAYGLPDPRAARVLVAETADGTLVGCWAACVTVHLDGLWVAPDYRKPSFVASKLLAAMRVLLRQAGIRHSFTMVEDPAVLILALKAGFEKLRVDLLLWDVGAEPEAEGDPSCPP